MRTRMAVCFMATLVVYGVAFVLRVVKHNLAAQIVFATYSVLTVLFLSLNKNKDEDEVEKKEAR